MTAFDAVAVIVSQAVEARVFPGAAAEVGSSHGVLWRRAWGRLTFDTGSAVTDVDTPFDLASLTKVLATTSVLMRLNADGKLRLDEPIATSLREWRGTDREDVTIRDLLAHASGLPARLVDASPVGRRELEHDICTMPLEYPPRTQSMYSDLGFILLGFLAEDRGGASLADQFDAIWTRLGAEVLVFDLPPQMKRRAAPTLPMDDDPRRGRVLAGEVHDVYAAALRGVAGHAGLFGTAPAVGTFARSLLRAARGASDVPAPLSAKMITAFVARTTVPGSSRALGWDTMLPGSSCGGRMSSRAFGHTGFTGTSLWIDPERSAYVVLLTNRVHPSRGNEAIAQVRPAVHDAVMEALGD